MSDWNRLKNNLWGHAAPAGLRVSRRAAFLSSAFSYLTGFPMPPLLSSDTGVSVHLNPAPKRGRIFNIKHLQEDSHCTLNWTQSKYAMAARQPCSHVICKLHSRMLQ